MKFAVKDNTIGGPRQFKIFLHVDGNHKMPAMHYHDAYEIYILEDGERFYMIEDKLVCLRARDILLIKPNVIHCTIGGTYRKSTIEFTNDYLRKFFTDYGMELATKCFEKSVIRVREKDFPQVLSMMERLLANNDDMSAFISLFMLLENNISRKTHDFHDTANLATNIVDYITAYYDDIDNLEEIANHFYISKQRLCHLFKQHTGTTIVKYINVLKVHASFEYLFNTDLSISEIAEKSGFCNVQYFSQVFKSIAGVSPLVYRKNGKDNSLK